MPWVRTRRRRRRCLLSLCIHTPRTIGTFVKKKTTTTPTEIPQPSFQFLFVRGCEKNVVPALLKKGTRSVSKKVPLHHKRFLFIDQCIFFVGFGTRIRITSTKLLCSILETQSFKIFDLFSRKGRSPCASSKCLKNF